VTMNMQTGLWGGPNSEAAGQVGSGGLIGAGADLADATYYGGSTVPEPATCLLMLCGGGVLALRTRKRRVA